MTTPALVPTFRYDGFPSELANAMQETATRIRARVQTATKAIIEDGVELIAIKRQIDRPEWRSIPPMTAGYPDIP